MCQSNPLILSHIWTISPSNPSDSCSYSCITFLISSGVPDTRIL
ncbi:hypothetical protein [Pseudomonas phage vB_Pa-PAC2]